MPKGVHKDIEATLGEDAPSYTMVNKWAAEFKRGRESLEDDPIREDQSQSPQRTLLTKFLI